MFQEPLSFNEDNKALNQLRTNYTSRINTPGGFFYVFKNILGNFAISRLFIYVGGDNYGEKAKSLLFSHLFRDGHKQETGGFSGPGAEQSCERHTAMKFEAAMKRAVSPFFEPTRYEVKKR